MTMRSINQQFADPTGRTASYVIVASNATALEKAQADVVLGATVNQTQINAALTALATAGVKQHLVLIGDFVTNDQINAVSNVDVTLNGTITCTSTGVANTIYFNNLVNTTWTDVVAIRAGAVIENNYDYTHQMAWCIQGTCDRSVQLINCTATNTSTGIGSGDILSGFVIITQNNTGPILDNCTGTGGHSTSQNMGIWVSRNFTGGGSSPLLRNCRGFGGYGGWSHGICVEEDSCPTLYGCEGWGGTSGVGTDSNGITIDNASNPIITNCIGHAGTALVSAGISFWGSSPDVQNCIGYTNTNTISYGISLEYGAAPRLIGCTGTAPMLASIWNYSSANNGRFTPDITANYVVMTMEVVVLVNQPGKTLSLGTTAGGTQIATGIDLGGGAGEPAFSITHVRVPAGTYMYATPSAAIDESCFRIYYSAMYSGPMDWSYGLYGLYMTNAGRADFTNCTFRSSWVDGIVYLAAATVANKTFRMTNCLIEDVQDTPSGAALNASSAITVVGIYNTTIIGNLANITSFIKGSQTLSGSGTWTVLNGQTSIVITHGLGWTPQAGDISIGFTTLDASTSCYIDTYTATQFTVHINVAATAATTTGWWKAIR
jgi:hypothetical protein